MMAAGDSAEHAHEMFDASVTVVFGVAGGRRGPARAARRDAPRAPARAARRADRGRGPAARRRRPGRARARGGAARSCATSPPPTTRWPSASQEQEAVRREFIVNASHELRTPLTNLQGYLEALRDGVIPPDPATFDSLREEVDRLTRLAVVARRPGGGRVRARPDARDVDVGAIVRASADLVAPVLARRSIALRVDAPTGLLVRARPDELTQVLANLLQNAVRYTPLGRRGAGRRRPGGGRRPRPGREHRARASRPRTCRGSGSASTASRSRATASRGGAGIGLAIVRQLVEDAGGRVGVTSEGGWTTFWLTLPARA